MQKRYSPKILKFGLFSNDLSEEMNMFPAAMYLRHLLTARSTAGYGVHSPFMYDFLNTVVRNKTDGNIVSILGNLRREMLGDNQRIIVTDPGAGSVTKAGEERSISEIARKTAVPAKEAGLLARMVAASTGSAARDTGSAARDTGSASRDDASTGSASRGTGIILELGTSLGISTLAMALAAPERKVVTVEGCPALAEIARENLKRYGASNATVLNMDFNEALDSLKKGRQQVSFAFIDGNHRGSELTEYVGKIAGMGEEMIIAADDIHLTKEMYLAWKSLAASGLAPATMETLHLGIFFRIYRLTPGRYRIRY